MAAVGHDWAAAKHTYSATATGKEIMWSLVRFRKWYVDAKLLELRYRYPNLRIRSVGSVTLTSDYDITVSGPGDVDAVEWFNNTFRREWGKESATVFDTNLYVKDFMPERSNFALTLHDPRGPDAPWWNAEHHPRSWKPSDTTGTWEAVGKPRIDPAGKDTEITQPTADTNRALADFDQDVAALTKQRKYMTQPQWDAYVTDIVAQAASRTRGTTATRYRAADSIHTRAVTDLAQQLAKETTAPLDGRTEQEIIDSFEHTEPDTVVRARNKLYIKLARQVRATQSAYNNDPTDENALLAKQQISYSLCHAMEAYHSEGAVRHVVGGQSGSGITVTPAHYLQSFNEQLGDFLKDLTHYADSGEAFFQSAKYLMRMVDAAQQAIRTTGVRLGDEGTALLEQLSELGHDDYVLLRIRKNRDRFDGMPTTEKSRAAVGEYRYALGVEDKDQLRQRSSHLRRKSTHASERRFRRDVV
ncbi:hypothetical protein ABZY03_33040 [Streptomyces klenkii]|uniref:hypothetical protein n=1 Tax=Streptomyces klenkii TaxID=1420899 RepID=UPI0033BC887E